MLSDEEKKAIEYWKTHLKILHWNTQLASEHYIKVLLDLIEKQSKEIEELKEKNEYLPNWVNKKYVSKAKIKAKIEEIKQKKYILSSRESEIEILQSLLEKEE